MSAVLTANVLCNTSNIVDDSKMAIRHEKLGHSCACMLGYFSLVPVWVQLSCSLLDCQFGC